jgi:hypothetical protein
MFLRGTGTNHTGPKSELALAKKLGYHHYCLKDEILRNGRGGRT